MRAILSGTVETFDADAFASQLAKELEVTADEVSLAVSAASVRVVATVRPAAAADDDDATAAAAVESVRAAAERLALRPADEISTILNVTVEEIEQPEVQTVLLPAPPIAPPVAASAATASVVAIAASVVAIAASALSAAAQPLAAAALAAAAALLDARSRTVAAAARDAQPR